MERRGSFDRRPRFLEELRSVVLVHVLGDGVPGPTVEVADEADAPEGAVDAPGGHAASPAGEDGPGGSRFLVYWAAVETSWERSSRSIANTLHCSPFHSTVMRDLG
jgi:hypothetical protein